MALFWKMLLRYTATFNKNIICKLKNKTFYPCYLLQLYYLEWTIYNNTNKLVCVRVKIVHNCSPLRLHNTVCSCCICLLDISSQQYLFNKNYQFRSSYKATKNSWNGQQSKDTPVQITFYHFSKKPNVIPIFEYFYFRHIIKVIFGYILLDILGKNS